MTARAMSDEEVDAAVRAACGLTGAQMWNRGLNLPDCRAIYRAAYAAATRDTAELCAVACERYAPCSRESAPEHWKSYSASWGLREMIVKDCAAACRKVGEA